MVHHIQTSRTGFGALAFLYAWQEAGLYYLLVDGHIPYPFLGQIWL